MTTTTIVKGDKWSANRYNDDSYGDVEPGTAEKILNRAVDLFEYNTGVSWQPSKGEVIGPVG